MLFYLRDELRQDSSSEEEEESSSDEVERDIASEDSPDEGYEDM
eukprot:SAG25_NODE_360_length_9166_cov_35.113488_7_plen_44_part_00